MEENCFKFNMMLERKPPFCIRWGSFLILSFFMFFFVITHVVSFPFNNELSMTIHQVDRGASGIFVQLDASLMKKSFDNLDYTRPVHIITNSGTMFRCRCLTISKYRENGGMMLLQVNGEDSLLETELYPNAQIRCLFTNRLAIWKGVVGSLSANN